MDKQTTNSKHEVCITPISNYITKMKVCDQRTLIQILGADLSELEEEESDDFKKKPTPVVTPPATRRPKSEVRARKKPFRPNKNSHQ